MLANGPALTQTRRGILIPAPGVEFPSALLRMLDKRGSFDCVVVRFANDNFAQDDRSLDGSEFVDKTG